jgi:hypothetical protein
MAIDNNAININPSGVVGDIKGIKPTYESPRMIPLGDLARGVGGYCHTGTNPDGLCEAGLFASGGSCIDGTTNFP